MPAAAAAAAAPILAGRLEREAAPHLVRRVRRPTGGARPDWPRAKSSSARDESGASAARSWRAARRVHYARLVPLTLFEVACVAVVVATLAAMSRSRPWRELGREYATLALAAWVGEQSCIALYRFYAYAPAWHARLGDVPALVPLIWPLVVLSAGEVVRALAPGARPLARAALVGAVVAFDASLVEVVAVRAGLWAWSEPGHLGVPLVGILGWGYFALGTSLARRPVWVVVAGPAAAHLFILASWWGLFRWTARGALGPWGFVVVAVACAAGLTLAVAARSRGRLLRPLVWVPRVLAALLFLVLLLATAAEDLPLWGHTALVAAPYLAATGLRA